MSAALWPLSVDGLLLLATIGLLKQSGPAPTPRRWVVWTAFLLGVAVSLAANIAAAPSLEWQPVLGAGWPPVALLSIELLAHRVPIQAEETPGSRAASGSEDASHSTGDPLLPEAVERDLRHRSLRQRPISVGNPHRGCF
ncbi:DUF2637 domain-containing protein [Streptomyces sp. NPDC054796]